VRHDLLRTAGGEEGQSRLRACWRFSAFTCLSVGDMAPGLPPLSSLTRSNIARQRTWILPLYHFCLGTAAAFLCRVISCMEGRGWENCGAEGRRSLPRRRAALLQHFETVTAWR